MPADDHNETFDRLIVTQALVDPTGAEHTGELADLADTGGGSAAGVLAVEDDGAVVVTDADAINFGNLLNVVNDGDGTVTVDSADTNLALEDTAGAVLITNPDRLGTGDGLAFTDDGDNTATLSAPGLPESVLSGSIELTNGTGWVDTGVTTRGAKITVPFAVNDHVSVREKLIWDPNSGTHKIGFDEVARGASYTGPTRVAYDVLHWGTHDFGEATTPPPSSGADMLAQGFESDSYRDTFTGSWRLGVYDYRSPTQVQEGASAMAVDIPNGNHYGMDADFDPEVAGVITEPVREMWASFWVWPDPDASSSDQIKLPGPERGEVNGGSSTIATDAFTAKMEHEIEADGTANFAYYAYHNDRAGLYGDYFPASYTDRPTAPAGTWVKVGQHVKLNTVNADGSGNHDGVLQLWINGTLAVDEHDIEFTEAPELGMHYAFVVYHGGSTTASSDLTLYFDDWRIGSTNYGVDTMPP